MKNKTGLRPIGVLEAIEKVGVETVQEELDFYSQRRECRKSAGQVIPEGVAMAEGEIQGKRVIVMGRSDGEGIDHNHTGTVIWLDGPPA